MSATVMHDMPEDSHGRKGNLRDHPVGTVSRKLYRIEEAIQTENSISMTTGCPSAGGSRNYSLVKDSADVD
jgi:hypothetical protein